jgi:transposase
MSISWRTVGNIIDRVVTERLNPNRLHGLKRIGVDEFSYLRRNNYITIVVDHDKKQVVWATDGRGAAALNSFFDVLGTHQCESISSITMDMAAGYIKAAEERLPNAQIVLDRFHVQRLASRAVDEVRREQVRALDGTPEARCVKKTRYALLKSPWNLTRRDLDKLNDIEANNEELFRAYLLKESLANALEQPTLKEATEELDTWTEWARDSELEPFEKLSRTIARHKDRILAYVKERLSNGLVEGFNNRLRMIARRAFGFHGPEPLISMLYLCCGGIQLDPPLPQPT